MTDATTEFFSALEARRHEPLLEKESGTLRFDHNSGKRTTRWLIEIENGDVSISHRTAGRLRRARQEIPLRRDRGRAAERHDRGAPRRVGHRG